MTIEDFIAMTRRIIAKDGFDDYLPTLVLPARRHISVLEGIPSKVDVELAARRWAEREAKPDEDFFLAFKVDAGNFKVVVRSNGSVTERLADVKAEQAAAAGPNDCGNNRKRA